MLPVKSPRRLYGALLRERIHAGVAAGEHDLITIYERATEASAAARPGDVIAMKSYGGDAQVVGTGADLCTTTVPSPAEYHNRYTYQHGLLASDEPLNSEGTGVGFLSADYSVDARGLVSSRRATDGKATAFTWKPWGAIESMTPPADAATTWFYANATSGSSPRVTSSTSGVITRFDYDRLGRLQRTERAVPGTGGSTCTEQVIAYDALGRRSSLSTWHPCGGTHEKSLYEYNALGRIARVTAPDGAFATTAYKGDRLITRTRWINDPAIPVITREELDLAGRLITLTENADSEGEVVTTYTYDAADRLTGVNMAGQSRTFTWDGRGFLTSETQPELGSAGDGTATYRYDSRGHLLTKSVGTIGVTMSYDQAERLKSVSETSSGRLLKQLAYDDYGDCVPPLCSGKLAAAARYHYDTDLGNPVVTESYQYRSDSGRLGRKDSVVGLSPSHRFAYEQHYNELGAVSQMSYPCPDGSTGCRHVTQAYTDGLLTGISLHFTDPPYSGSYATLSYHPAGTIDTVTHLGGAIVREVWSPDPHGMARPQRIRTESDAGATLWTSGAYSYDQSGNIVRIGDGAHKTYRHDAFGRLISWTDHAPDGGFSSVGRAFDVFGNAAGDSVHGCGPAGGPAQRCWTSSVLAAAIDGTTNRYVTDTHDDAGNITGSGTSQYAYDALGMMVRSTRPGLDLRFLYGADDERIAAVKVVAGGNEVTYTLRDFESRLLSVWTRSSQAMLQWKEDSIWRGATLLARESASLGTTHDSVDHLGSPIAITGWSGALIDAQKFAPFGAGGTSNGGALQFTGQERDAANLAAGATNLPDYFHARYYDPDRGRFLSVDPVLDVKRALAEPQRWNRYSYVINNPLRYTDPDGREIYAQVHEVTNQATDMVTEPQYHVSIRIEPNDQAAWADDRFARVNPETGHRYATLGAGPERPIRSLFGFGGTLVGGVNRPTDRDLTNKVVQVKLDLGGRDENKVIEALFSATAAYKNDKPYALKPQASGGGYNSNSFVSGVIRAVGLVPPTLRMNLPGYAKPLPVPCAQGPTAPCR